MLWETLETYPSWAGGGQLVERLGEQDLGVAHGVSDGVVLLLASEGQLGEGRLVARGVLDVDEVLVVGRAVVLRQFEEPDEGLEQRGPGGERTTDTPVTHRPRCAQLYANRWSLVHPNKTERSLVLGSLHSVNHQISDIFDRQGD